jgi:hypothetical protein
MIVDKDDDEVDDEIDEACVIFQKFNFVFLAKL